MQKGAPNGGLPLMPDGGGKKPGGCPGEELAYLSIAGSDGFSRNPQNFWDGSECFPDSLEFQAEAKGKRSFEFHHSVMQKKWLLDKAIGLERGPLPQGVHIRIKK